MIVIYTAKTIHELGEIPFFCPLDYDYQFAQLHSICQLRTSNLIFMWIASISVLYAWIRTLVPEFIYHKIDDDKNKNNKNDENDDESREEEYSEEEKQGINILNYVMDLNK